MDHSEHDHSSHTTPDDSAASTDASGSHDEGHGGHGGHDHSAHGAQIRETHFDTVGSSAMLHGVAMTALTWIVFPYIVYLAKNNKFPFVRGVLSAISLVVIGVSSAHMFIYQVARGRAPSLHGTGGWFTLLALATFFASELMASMESIKNMVPRESARGSVKAVWKGMGLFIFFVLCPLVWFYGIYEALGMLKEHFNQAGGHTMPGGAMLILSGNMMFGPVNERKKLLFEGIALTIFGFMYLSLDLMTGYFAGGYVGLVGIQHMSTSLCWALGGLLTLVLLRTGNEKYNSAGLAAVTYIHIQVMLNHPNHNHGQLSMDLHSIHTGLMACTLLLRILGNWYLAGVSLAMAAGIFISSQAGFAMPLATMGWHSSVYMMVTFASTLLGITYFTLLFANTAEEEEAGRGTRPRSSSGHEKQGFLAVSSHDHDIDDLDVDLEEFVGTHK